MGVRKRLDRWGVGGFSQHMGLRGWKESGPGGGWMEERWAAETALGAGTRAGSGGRRVNRTEGKRCNPQRWRRGVGAATAELTLEPEKAPGAQRLAQGRPLMAPQESDAVSIF